MIRRPPRSTLFPSTPLSRSRSALGATRRRVLRQLLVESLVPSVVGAALATVVGQVATRSLLRAIPEGVRIDMPYLTNVGRSEEHTSELQSQSNLVCRLLLEK